jgi:hypothetical protein
VTGSLPVLVLEEGMLFKKKPAETAAQIAVIF